MTWKRFHLVLCIICAAVAVLRIVTGNYIGAIIPIVLAVVFGSIAMDYPIIKRIRQIWSLGRRTLR
jgi:hypothetical protein